MVEIKKLASNRVVAVFVFCLISISVFFQVRAFGLIEHVFVKNTSPYEVYKSFVDSTVKLEDDYKDYVNDKTKYKLKNLLDDLGKIRRLFDLSEIAPANRVREGDNSIAYLYDILARLPAVEIENIPGYKNENMEMLPSRWTIPGTNIQIVRMESGQYSGEYQFSANSIRNLEGFYESIIDHPILNDRDFVSFFIERSNATGYLVPDYFSRWIPDVLKKHYFSTPLWKVMVVFCFYFVFFVTCFFCFKFLYKKNKLNAGFKKTKIQILMPVGFLFFIFILDWFVVTQINPVGSLANFFGLSISVFYFLALSWFSWSLVYLLSDFFVYVLRFFSKEVDSSFLKLVNKLAAIVVSVFVLIVGFDQIGIPALGIVAGFGVGGIAIALASQSTIENLFGGLSLFIDRPFSVGDKIFFNKQSAQILHVGPRSTRIRARDGSLCTVPNSDLAKMHIVNYSLRDSFYINQNIELRNDSKTSILKDFLNVVNLRVFSERLVEKKDGWPRVKLVEISAGRIVVRIQAIVLTTDYSEFLSIQESLVLDVLSVLEEMDLKLARNVYYESKS